jgi:quercetin dioxygenase-like cupin family protein
MKTLFRGALLSCALLSVASLALAKNANAAAAKAKPAGIVMTTPADLKWVVNPANADVSMAVLWGDPAKGAHGAFHKFKAGFDAGVHSHSSDMRLVVVSGTIIAGAAGGPEKKLPAGSYEYQQHGAKHVTKCDAASECVIFVVSSGKFDIIPADAPKK